MWWRRIYPGGIQSQCSPGPSSICNLETSLYMEGGRASDSDHFQCWWDLEEEDSHINMLDMMSFGWYVEELIPSGSVNQSVIGNIAACMSIRHKWSSHSPECTCLCVSPFKGKLSADIYLQEPPGDLGNFPNEIAFLEVCEDYMRWLSCQTTWSARTTSVPWDKTPFCTRAIPCQITGKKLTRPTNIVCILY